MSRTRPVEQLEALKSELVGRAQELLQEHTGFDLIPASGKVVVLDSQLDVKNAFFALQEHEIKAAPVWDSSTRLFTGMLTVTDFIDILRHLASEEKADVSRATVESMTLADWAQIKWKQGTQIGKLLYIYPYESVLEAVKIMSKHRIHRLCVLEHEPGNAVLGVLTLHRLVRFLVEQFGTAPFMDLTVQELDVGTFDNIITITYDTPLREALDLLSRERISGLPVVDRRDGTAIDIYSRSDVRFLASDGTYDITSLSVGEALSKHKHERPVPFCHLSDTLQTVLLRLVATRKHRLLCVDEQRHLLGLVSLSDIFHFFAQPDGTNKPKGDSGGVPDDDDDDE